jgi:hypothetical protein
MGYFHLFVQSNNALAGVFFCAVETRLAGFPHHKELTTDPDAATTSSGKAGDSIPTSRRQR